SDQGRDFHVHVLLGPQATDTDRDLVLATLSSMRVDLCPPAELPRPASFSATSGKPGDSVTVFGPTFRDEDGFYLPADRVEVWWGQGQSGASGPRIQIVGQTADVRGTCSFGSTFTVPNVP